MKNPENMTNQELVELDLDTMDQERALDVLSECMERRNSHNILRVNFFEVKDPEELEEIFNSDDDKEDLLGWYYNYSFPGCIPENQFPFGPHESYEEAIKDALDSELDNLSQSG